MNELIKRVIIVLAKWCPHCVPLALDYVKKMAEELHVPLRVLDIDKDLQLKAADKLVEQYGDWSEDYIIPQVFLEYTDGRTNHIFTGFSEGLHVSEEAWKDFYKNSFYQILKREQFSTNESLKEFVKNHLTFKGTCRIHCDQTSLFEDVFSDSKNIVGAYVCPGGFVSRVVYFSVNPDINWFKRLLQSQLGRGKVNDHDIRLATRYGWEIGDDARIEMQKFSPSGAIREVYWTIDLKKIGKDKGVFHCLDTTQGKGCRRLYINDIGSKNKLCPKCK